MDEQRTPWWVRRLLLLTACAAVGCLIVLPAANVVWRAFEKGAGPYFAALADRDTLHALWLTAVVAGLCVGINLAFGVAASWAIAKHEFPGRSFLTALIDLPFGVSPVVSGLIFVLTFGAQSALGRWLNAHEVRILFAAPGILLATLFVTFPYVAREVMPVMEALGNEQEEAAITLGASGWQTFLWVTLPNIRWGVLYGVILCASRALGEFGAVSLVAGRIAGRTDTLSLRVEKLVQEYQSAAAFAVASILLLLALATLVVKTVTEARLRRALEESTRATEPS